MDTGSALSVLPRTFKSHATRAQRNLTAANGSVVHTYGTVQLNFRIQHLNQAFVWNFTIADVTQPILGADFFAHFGLLVDCKNRTLVPSGTPKSLSTTPNAQRICSLVIEPRQYITQNFPNTISGAMELNNNTRCISKHVIATLPCAPVRQRRRELSQERRTLAEEEFRQLEATGVIRRSCSPWAAPLQIVTKKDGSLRICGDYRGLNRVTIPDSYPMPLITDILQRFSGCSVFSSLDLAKAYHQIPVDDDSIMKTAIITPFGLFEYLRMPFGLRNASQTFQRHIDIVLQGMSHTAAYIDDIIVGSPDVETHQRHLTETLSQLNTHHLKLKLEKCKFFQQEVEFLGHIISKDGIRPLPERLKAISTFPKPETVTALRSFLGLVNYCRRFIPHLSETLAVLTDMSSGPKKQRLTWSKEAETAFDKIRTDILKSISLRYPDSSLPLILTTDASNIAVGAALSQIRDGRPEPLEFFSHKLSGAQTRYSTFDRELLGLFLSVKHFEHLLVAQSTTLHTDHKPLLHIFEMKNPSPRQQRQISYLSQFDIKLNYIAGADNVVADCFSRIEIGSLEFEPLFSKDTLEENPPSIKDLAVFREKPTARGQIYYDTSFAGCPRPILGERLRSAAFQAVHSIAHPGAKATYELLRTKVVWPYMRRDVKLWCKSCFQCQANKITRHTRPPILTFPTGSRFEIIHMDIVGPLPLCSGYSYLLTIIDRNTRWPEAFPIRSISTETIVDIFVNNWISRFGVPKRVITDQGRQFESNLFNALLKRLGTQRFRTTAFHPQSNGLVERFHHTLKNLLRTMTIQKDWIKQLPFILLGWRNIPSSRHGTSPAQMVFGSNTSLVNELFFDDSPKDDKQLELARKHFNDLDTAPGKHGAYRVHVPRELKFAKFAWLLRENPTSFQTRYTGPYRLVHLDLQNNTATIDCNGTHRIVNTCKLKPCICLEDDQDNVHISTLTKRNVTFASWVQVFESPHLIRVK